MRFSQIEGNEELKKALAGMVDSGKIPHAILFHEEDGGGAFPLCQAFLQYLYCSDRHDGDSCEHCPSCSKIGRLIHPDVHYLFPIVSAKSTDTAELHLSKFRALVAEKPLFRESDFAEAMKFSGKNAIIASAQAKALLDTLSLSALEGGYRAVVIYLPEKMNAETANKLLKMIEEPPLQTQFLMISHKPEAVLQTISSRCLRLRVRPSAATAAGGVSDSGFDRPELFSTLMDALVAKNLLSCILAAEEIAAVPSREGAKAFCSYAAESLRKVFLLQQGLVSLAGECSEEQRRWAKALPATFSRRALEVLSRAQVMVGRNVNLKVLFTDMADRLYMTV